MAKRRLSFQRHPSTAPGPPPRFVQQHEKLKAALDWTRGTLNFYRVHMLFFLLTPCIVAGIFYASNGENHIDYIDALFMVSPAPSCPVQSSPGLRTASELTSWLRIL